MNKSEIRWLLALGLLLAGLLAVVYTATQVMPVGERGRATARLYGFCLDEVPAGPDRAIACTTWADVAWQAHADAVRHCLAEADRNVRPARFGECLRERGVGP